MIEHLFDQTNDKPHGCDDRRGDGFESSKGVRKPVEPDGSVDGSSSFTDPALMEALRRLALRYLPGKRNWHNREDLVQSALQYLLEFSAKRAEKAPLTNFRPKDHAWHAIQRVLRDLRGKKRSFSNRMPALSSLPEDKAVIPKSRPSNPEFQARLAFDTALAKLDQRHREIVLAWRIPDRGMTFEKIAGYFRCSRATVSNVIKNFEQLVREITDDLRLN